MVINDRIRSLGRARLIAVVSGATVGRGNGPKGGTVHTVLRMAFKSHGQSRFADNRVLLARNVVGMTRGVARYVSVYREPTSNYVP